MLTRKHFLTFLITSAMTLALVTTSSLVEGKGKPGGGGGSDDPPTTPELPAGLDIRYQVQYVPIPANATGFFAQDINDQGEAVGWYELTLEDGSSVRSSYLYDAVTGTYFDSSSMITLPARWVSLRFSGMNNRGAIVGQLMDVNSIQAGILIYPDTGSATGWSFDIMPTPAGVKSFYFRKINDYGDIAGRLTYGNGDQDNFAYNSGLYDVEDNTQNALPFTPFGMVSPSFLQVSNSRQGVSEDSTGIYLFNFVDAQTLYDAEPNNDVNPFQTVLLAPETYSLGASNGAIANDGQLAIDITVGKGKNRGTTPGVYWGTEFLWEGSEDGYSYAVNSREGLNTVGDVLTTDFVTWSLQHANWGKLDVEAMLVFETNVDEDLWIPNNFNVNDMSDRELTTGFGFLTGHHSLYPFVLVPVEIPVP